MGAHSKGPWRWVRDSVGELKARRLLDANGRAVFWPVRPVRDPLSSTDIECRSEADARLIALAPEMLDALKEALEDWDGWSRSRYEAMCDVVKRARGE